MTHSTLFTRCTLTALLAGTAMLSQAQTLTGITLDPPSIQAGQTVKLTANFDVANNAVNCNVRIKWGDGAEEMFHINQAKDVPLVLNHSYPKAGGFEVKVEPKNDLPALKCLGKAQKTILTVTAPAAKPAASTSTPVAAASACPTGWKLKGAVNKKTGAYTCSAQPGTALPEPKPTCPGELTYFDNVKKGQFGCRP